MPFQDSNRRDPVTYNGAIRHSPELDSVDVISYHQDMNDRVDTRDNSPSSCGSIMGSTDDGILTPTCTLYSHSETTCLPASADAKILGSTLRGGRSTPNISQPEETHSSKTNLRDDLSIEKEINRRVEAELVARELAALRKEKQEWQQMSEHAAREWQHRLALLKEANEQLVREVVSLRSIPMDVAVAPKAPIRFQDAVGRKFSFPFHLASTWNNVSELIQQAFLHVDVLGPHVKDGHYDLICSSGRYSGDYILPQVWEAMVEPGWQITMHMWPLPGMPQSVGSTLNSVLPLPLSPQERPVSRPANSWHRKVNTDRGMSGMPAPPPLPPRPASFPTINVIQQVSGENPKRRSASTNTTSDDISMVVVNEDHSSNSSCTHSCSPSIISSVTTNIPSSQQDMEAVAALKTLIDAKRIFVVGKLGSIGRRVVQVHVKPKRKGVTTSDGNDGLTNSGVRNSKGVDGKDKRTSESQGLEEVEEGNIGPGEGEGVGGKEKPAWVRSVFGHMEMAPRTEWENYDTFQGKPIMY